MKDERGFVYVATGKGYVAEAVHSAKQLKKIHPDIPICLVADKMQEDVSVFDDLILLEEGEATYTPIDKVHCVRCPYREAVFLDSDTWAANKIDELFGILTKFDLALLPENKRGWNYHLPGVPRPFAEFNTGVIVFRNDEGRAKPEKRPAQFPLRPLELRSAGGAHPERIPFPGQRIELHHVGSPADTRPGRPGKIAALVNKRMGSRVYIPQIGAITGFTGKWDWIKKLLPFAFRGLSVVWKKRKDTAKLAPKKWW
ncbi:MAG: hypothetical protein IPG32_10080 [Saprospirales bacterium]|nr:hypothetical protein [Saprospirales bacterium]